MNHSKTNPIKTMTLYGVSTLHDEGKSYGEEIKELLDRVWAEIREKKLSSSGINHVVYDEGSIIFAGTELKSPVESEVNLEKKEYRFEIYAYWKHTGPYSKLGDTHTMVRRTIHASGQQHTNPIMEIYGHWQEDESKLETEILYTLK